MPATERAERFTDLYHGRVATLADVVARQLVARFDVVDPEDLGPSLDLFVTDAAAYITLGQANAATLSAAFFRGLARLDADVDVATEQDDDNVGKTVDGRELTDALRSIPAKLMLAIRSGRTLQEALAFGRFATARTATTEVMDAARVELRHQMQEVSACEGWRWRSRGTCAACMALDDGDTKSPGASLNGHPYCRCVQEPVFTGADQIVRQTGHEKLYALEDDEQNRLLGVLGATLLRDGRVTPSDLVVVQAHRDWRSTVTTAPAAVLAARSGLSEDEIRALEASAA